MKRHELEVLQTEILKRIAGNDGPPEYSAFQSPRQTIDLWNVSKHKSAFIDYASFLSHEEAARRIQAIAAFYEAATPEDIAILNMDTSTCKHCEEELTEDEFYPVSSTTGRVGVETHANQHTGEITTIYCKKCIQVVPHCAFRKERPGYVYLAEWNGVYKIGMSQNPENRIIGLRKDYPGIELLHYFPCNDAYATEVRMHTIYTHRHEFSEFFSLTAAEVDRISYEVGE